MEFFSTPTWLFIAIAIVAFNTGLSKGGFGGGLGALSTPFLSLLMPATLAVGVMLPILMLGDVFAVASYWRTWDNDALKRTLPWAIVATVIATVFVSVAPAGLLKTIVGVVALLFAAWQLLQSRLAKPVDAQLPAWAGPLAGVLAGVTSAMANAGGPPFVIYMLLRKTAPKLMVATGAIFFALLNISKLPVFIQSGVLKADTLITYWWLMPLVPLGIWVGRRIVHRLNRDVFEKLILVFLALTGVLLLVGR